MTLTTVNSLYTLGATASIDADESELSCHSHSHSLEGKHVKQRKKRSSILMKDAEERCFVDSFAELPEHDEAAGGKKSRNGNKPLNTYH